LGRVEAWLARACLGCAIFIIGPGVGGMLGHGPILTLTFVIPAGGCNQLNLNRADLWSCPPHLKMQVKKKRNVAR
jgi:hypothetical protein